jgi:hypothetical protein
LAGKIECATAVITIMNPTSEPVTTYSISACDSVRVRDGTVQCEGSVWGGFLGEDVSCLAVMVPGESCEITLVGDTNKKGGSNGYLLITANEGTEIPLLLPVKIRGV